MGYVCARIRSTGKAYSRITSHNIRFIPPEYLKSEPNSETYYIELDGTRHIFIAHDAERAREIVGHDLKRREARMRAEYKEKHGRSMTTSFVPFTEGFLVFSSEPFSNEGFNMDEWKSGCLEFAADFAASQNARLVYAAFHYDESTPHLHYLVENFDKKEKTTWQRTFGRQKCRELQDLAASRFSEMGFSRGESKSISGAEHKSLIESHAIERQKTVAKTVEIKFILNDLESKINFEKKKLDDLRTEIKSRGEERKKLIAELQKTTLDSEERKKQYREFDLQTKILKKSRDDLADQVMRMQVAQKDISAQIRAGTTHVDSIREMVDAIRNDEGDDGVGYYVTQAEELRIVASALADRLGEKNVADALKTMAVDEVPIREIAKDLEILLPDHQIDTRYLDASKCAPGDDAHEGIGDFSR